MRVLVTLLALLVSVSSGAPHDVYPGTNRRPILSDQEAALFTKEAYLQGWTPPDLLTTKADYTVGDDGYHTIQAAVNDAIKAGGTTRKYIYITMGLYEQIVYIPFTNVPITLYAYVDDYVDNNSVVIAFDLSATITGFEYANLVGALFKPEDPAYSMYSECANRSVIGTECSAVVWIRAPNVQIISLTIGNSSNNENNTNQGVALYTQEDNFQVANCQLFGSQGTFLAGTPAQNSVIRGHVTDSTIDGDTNIIFGGGSVVFERCIISAYSLKPDYNVIFAPASAATNQYGYLVIESEIVGSSKRRSYLARAWDFGLTSFRNYVAGASPNGQLVVRETSIFIFLGDAPYTTSTSGRPYSGNGNRTRDLNDPHFNRFWEYPNEWLDRPKGINGQLHPQLVA